MNAARFQHAPRRGSWARVALCLVIVVSALVALPPVPASAAISKPAGWTQQYASATYPSGAVNATYTVAAGSNRLLVVAIASTRTTAGSQTVSSVTYGGQALTLAAGDGGSTATWNHSYLYYLNEAGIGAATGTSLNVTITGGTSYYTWVYAAVYAGVDQTTPFTSARNFNSTTTTDALVGPFNPTLTIANGDQAIEIVNLARSASGTFLRTISTWATGWDTAGVAASYNSVSGPTAQMYIRDRNVLTAANDGSQHTASSISTWDSMTAMSIKPAPVGNTAPTVNAGTDKLVSCNAVMALSGPVSDDGLPSPPGQTTSTWSVVSVPAGATATINTPTQVNTAPYPDTHSTTVTYNNVFGAYTFQLGANDSLLDATPDQVVVTVGNILPAVNAGTDQVVTVPTANLDATVSNDGCGTQTTLWTMTSGPGTVTFGNANAVDTTATFSEPGTYILRLTANDTYGSVYDEITIRYVLTNPPVQVFYVSLPEDQALGVFQTLYPSSCGTADLPVAPVNTYFSIAIGVDGTVVYYDQWEDGYAADIANPGAEIYNAATHPEGVQIWGDGVAEDGCPPNKAGVALACTDANDVLNAGDVIVPNNPVPVPRGTTILFDARDKIAATSSIAMARTVWPNGSNTLQAFAHELYATAEWGTAFESPVGPTTTGSGVMFEYTALAIMASQNSTTVYIDKDANGSYETTASLNEGGATLVTGISQGARVQTSNPSDPNDPGKPIQVVLLTGDICSTYEARDMTLLPTSVYDSSYWAMVGIGLGDDWWSGTNPPGTAYTVGPTRLFLYNPSTNNSIYITCEQYGQASTTLGPVAARGVVTYDLDLYQGAHCFASTNTGTPTTDKIFGIATVDTESGHTASRCDWSFTLLPESFLSTDALVGLGLGRDPTQAAYQTHNGSPLWVTPACDTYVYVDWDGDGTADAIDLNGDGDTLDNDVGGYANLDEPTSANGLLVLGLQSVRLFEPPLDTEPFDQTAARVWTRTEAGKPVRSDPTATPGCKMALAWGQDPNNAYMAEPAFDAGTTVPPLRPVEGVKSLTLITDADHNGVVSPGDTVQYLITIRNAGTVPVNTIVILDTVGASWQYVANTTEWSTDTITWHPIGQPDEGVLPLSQPGGVPLGSLAAGQTLYVHFQVILAPGDYEDVSNCFTAITDAGTYGRCTTTQAASRDWGDLPDSYGTTAAANGPRHSYNGLTLGSLFDVEPQGVATAGANGDDLANVDDETGVLNTASGQAWYQGNGAFQVAVTKSGCTTNCGCLNAWMDFTNDAGTTAPAPDGNFVDLADGGYDRTPNTGTTFYSEHIIVNQLLNAGATTLSMTGKVPAGINAGETTSFYMRFRLSPPETCTDDVVGPTGLISGGEVEDYLFNLGTPTAIKLNWFTATPVRNRVVLGWETADERENAGFNLYRATSPDGERTQINDELIPTLVPTGSPYGAVYEFIDKSVKRRTTYYYWLEAVDISGKTQLFGPRDATVR